MLAEQALYELLRAHTGVTAIVADRIYPLRLPDEVILPAIAYRKISCTRTASHSGNSKLASARFQIDCYSEDYLSAKQLAYAVIEALHGHKDAVLQAVFAENESDGFDSGDVLFRAGVEAAIWHKEE